MSTGYGIETTNDARMGLRRDGTTKAFICSTPNQQIDTETGTDGFSFLYLRVLALRTLFCMPPRVHV